MSCMFSIIVPVYNVGKYIEKCIESIINQTYQDLEIILVDDGSTDDCPEICDRFAAEDKRIKVIHKENGGLMSARQAGLKIACGEYVGFVDGDDWIEPDMYESFYSAVKAHNPDIAMCEFYFAYPDKKVASSQILSAEFYDKKDMEKKLYPYMLFNKSFYKFGIFPCCWSKLFKKELLEKCLYKVTPEIRVGEDAAFTYPCLLLANSAAYVKKSLYNYRVNPESMTKAYSRDMEDTILIPYEILKKAFADYDYNLSAQLSYYLIYLVNMMIRNEANPGNKKTLAEIKNTLKKFVNNSDVLNSARFIDRSLLPLHTRFVAGFISSKNTNLLYCYIHLLRRFL